MFVNNFMAGPVAAASDYALLTCSECWIYGTLAGSLPKMRVSVIDLRACGNVAQYPDWQIISGTWHRDLGESLPENFKGFAPTGGNPVRWTWVSEPQRGTSPPLRIHRWGRTCGFRFDAELIETIDNESAVLKFGFAPPLVVGGLLSLFSVGSSGVANEDFKAYGAGPLAGMYRVLEIDGRKVTLYKYYSGFYGCAVGDRFQCQVPLGVDGECVSEETGDWPYILWHCTVPAGHDLRVGEQVRVSTGSPYFYYEKTGEVIASSETTLTVKVAYYHPVLGPLRLVVSPAWYEYYYRSPWTRKPETDGGYLGETRVIENYEDSLGLFLRGDGRIMLKEAIDAEAFVIHMIPVLTEGGVCRLWFGGTTDDPGFRLELTGDNLDQNASELTTWALYDPDGNLLSCPEYCGADPPGYSWASTWFLRLAVFSEGGQLVARLTSSLDSSTGVLIDEPLGVSSLSGDHISLGGNGVGGWNALAVERIDQGEGSGCAEHDSLPCQGGTILSAVDVTFTGWLGDCDYNTTHRISREEGGFPPCFWDTGAQEYANNYWVGVLCWRIYVQVIEDEGDSWLYVMYEETSSYYGITCVIGWRANLGVSPVDCRAWEDVELELYTQMPPDRCNMTPEQIAAITCRLSAVHCQE